MTKNELIKNLKQLKQIKPNQDWVIFSKSQVLGQEPQAISFLEILKSLRFLFQKPAYATIIIAMFLVFGLAIFGPVLTEKEIPVKVVETPEKIVYIEPKTEEQKEIIIVLEKLELDINQATKVLKEIKIEDPQEILKARGAIVSTINITRSAIVDAKNLETESKNKVLAAIISDTNNNINNLENNWNEKQATRASQSIEKWELKIDTLNETQKQILEKAKSDYQNKKYYIVIIHTEMIKQIELNKTDK